MLFWRKKIKKLMKYLNGELTPLEKKIFEEEIKGDRELLSTLEKIREIDNILPLFKLKKAPPHLNPRILKLKKKEKPPVSLFITSLAAIILIFIISSTIYYFNARNFQKVERIPVVEGKGKKIFKLKAPGASYVSVVGDFNSWNPDATPMIDLTGEGEWYAEVDVSEGAYNYQFLVDGKIILPDFNSEEFMSDGFGGTNSLVLIFEK